MRFTRIAIAAFAASSLLLAGCSDDAQDDVQDTAEDIRDDAEETAEDVGDEISETADDAQARTQGEALRAAIVASDDADEEGVRSIQVIEDAIDTVPGDTTFTGVEDTTGDGMDDDGLIEVEVNDSFACVELPEDGNDIDVSGGAC